MATQLGGYMGKVLKIDLSTQAITEYPWEDKDRALYLGGKTMAAKIIYDHLINHVDPVSIDPLAPENIIVITTGPLTGAGAPSSSRFNISTLSPLTGLIGSSNSGGSFGLFLKKAGYDGLIIEGKAESPIWIEIIGNQITFHDGKKLWGLSTSETQLRLGERPGKLVIGPAGENKVKYASIVSDDRISGRTGVGAVMGSKNLKAIVASGKHSIRSFNTDKKKKLFSSWVKQLKKHPITGEQLPKLGTAGLLSSMNRKQLLATRNFKAGQFEDYEEVSGERLAEKHLIKNKGCLSCPIQCSRVVELDGQQIKGPELETLGLLGPNIVNDSLHSIIRWSHLLDELGMDTISAGGTLAFAMELQEKGLWDNGLKFGEISNIEATFYDIAYRKGIGDLLAEGSKRLSEQFGGKEFAMHVKGLEMSAYEPRGAVGQGLGYAISNRGACHINGGYMVLMEGLGLGMNPHSPNAKAALTIMFQNLMEAVSAGGTCVFTMYAVIPGALLKNPNSLLSKSTNQILSFSKMIVHLINQAPEQLLPIQLSMLPHIEAIEAVTGMKMNFGRFKAFGERGYLIERLINIKRGLKPEDDTLPTRLVEELQDKNNPNSKVPLEALIKEYYKLRGYEPSGIPNKKKLEALKIF